MSRTFANSTIRIRRMRSPENVTVEEEKTHCGRSHRHRANFRLSRSLRRNVELSSCSLLASADGERWRSTRRKRTAKRIGGNFDVKQTAGDGDGLLKKGVAEWLGIGPMRYD